MGVVFIVPSYSKQVHLLHYLHEIGGVPSCHFVSYLVLLKLYLLYPGMDGMGTPYSQECFAMVSSIIHDHEMAGI